MNLKINLIDMPETFRDEKKILLSKGFDNWESLAYLRDKDLNQITNSSKATLRNLKKIRGIAVLISQINISAFEASLLIHAGFGTISALANATPQELIQKIGRLERKLNTYRKPPLNLVKAGLLIKAAKNRQI